MSGIFEQTPANRRRYGVAIFVGIIAGLISAFVKWGAEHPFPPRSPLDLFTAACKDPSTSIRSLFARILKPAACFLT